MLTVSWVLILIIVLCCCCNSPSSQYLVLWYSTNYLRISWCIPSNQRQHCWYLLSLSVDEYALVANVESYSKGGVVDMLMHLIVDVCWCTSLHPQRDRCHGITTANQKSVKNWSSEYIGGVPTALMCYQRHPVCTILIVHKKTDVGGV